MVANEKYVEQGAMDDPSAVGIKCIKGSMKIKTSKRRGRTEYVGTDYLPEMGQDIVEGFLKMRRIR